MLFFFQTALLDPMKDCKIFRIHIEYTDRQLFSHLFPLALYPSHLQFFEVTLKLRIRLNYAYLSIAKGPMSIFNGLSHNNTHSENNAKRQ